MTMLSRLMVGSVVRAVLVTTGGTTDMPVPTPRPLPAWPQVLVNVSLLLKWYVLLLTGGPRVSLLLGLRKISDN